MSLLIVASTVAMYLPSLHGPYLLDDTGNLEPVKRWLDGTLTWRGVVFDNRSGPTGRPLSMVTFLFDAWRAQSMNSFAFKTTNLFLHMLCGALMLVLIRQLLEVTSSKNKSSNAWLALVLATLWLWLPINVSTVAYVIQRMAQLSALWTLATISTYVAFRRALASKSSPLAIAGLWLGVPLIAAAAVLSKENGAVALLLVAVVEGTIFLDAHRPRIIKIFLAITVGLPTLAGVTYLAWHPDYFSAGYAARDFTIDQRLLSEPRILWSYLGSSFLPIDSMIGIYHDNYKISRSLWQPASTGIAIAAWAMLLIWAIAWRRKVPLFTLGVVGYLVGHIIESGPVALELYFEHRNYLPSIFAIIGITGLVQFIIHAYAFTTTFRTLMRAGMCLLVTVYGLGTWNYASAWSDASEFYALQYSYNPTSPRLLSALTARAMLAKDLPSALLYIDAGERFGNSSELGTATLWRVLAYCETGTAPIPSSVYDELESRAHGRITNYGMVAWDLLGNRIDMGCSSIDARRIARAGTLWVADSPQAAGEQPVWRTRYNLARILASASRYIDAQVLARRAWIDSEKNNGVGMLLFQLSASLDDVDQCQEVLTHLELSYGKGDKNLDAAVDAFRNAMPELRNNRREPAATQ